jgi:hypothetical protein
MSNYTKQLSTSWGWQTEVSYAIKGKDIYGFQFGNATLLSSQVFISRKISSFRLIAAVGLQFENHQSSRLNGQENNSNTNAGFIVSTKGSINLYADTNFIVKTKGKILLGDPDETKTQSLLLGDKTVDLLSNLLIDLQTIANQLSSLTSLPPGAPFIPLNTAAISFNLKLQNYQSQLSSLLSKVSKTK